MSNRAKIILPAKLENLKFMIKFIQEGAERQGFDKKESNQIQTASEEALVNIINYAYPDKEGNIEINYDASDNKRSVIEIIDCGIPFDPLTLPKPDINASIEDRKIGGLGIYMMRKIMDEVNYKRKQGKNILTLIFFHQGSPE
jgi:anti-sigma regulatory factor (Ser/Thr protein kinase)